MRNMLVNYDILIYLHASVHMKVCKHGDKLFLRTNLFLRISFFFKMNLISKNQEEQQKEKELQNN